MTTIKTNTYRFYLWEKEFEFMEPFLKDISSGLTWTEGEGYFKGKQNKTMIVELITRNAHKVTAMMKKVNAAGLTVGYTKTPGEFIINK